jgi:GT2 family glycosyltransferase
MHSDENPGSFSSIQDDRNEGAGGDLRDASQSPRSSIDVSIIVVSYNTREMTLECLRSIIAETTQVEYEVLFIDNCSTDGSFDAVHDEFGDDSRFYLVLADENLGFAGANNVLAESAKGKYLLLLNPDTVVLDRAIEELLEFAEENPKNGIWGGRTVFADGSLNPTSCWGPFTLWSEFCRSFGLRAMFPESLIFNPRSYGRWQRDSIREVGIVTGCFFLMRIEDWNALGGFDPEFFMYGEEADLCMRGIRRGMRPIVTPNATIIHHGGASEPIQVDKMVRLHDANVRLFRRHFSDLGFRFAFLTMRFGILLRSIVVSIRNGIRRRPIGNNWSCLWQRRNEWTRGAVGRKLGPSE